MCSMQCRDALLLPCAAFCFVCWVCCSTFFMQFHIYEYPTSFQQGEGTTLHVLWLFGRRGLLELEVQIQRKTPPTLNKARSTHVFFFGLVERFLVKTMNRMISSRLQSYPFQWIWLTTRVATHPPLSLTHHFNHSCQFDLLGHHCPGANEDPWAKDGLLQGAAAVMAVDVEAALRTKRSDHHGHYSHIFLYDHFCTACAVSSIVCRI